MEKSPWLSCTVGEDILGEIGKAALNVTEEVNKPRPNSQLHFQFLQIRLSYLFLENAHLTPGNNVLDTALACGFSSHSGFTWAFTAYTGNPPREYLP